MIEEAKRAITIAPDYAPGHAALAITLADAYLVSPDDPAEVARIRAIAKRALNLAPDDAVVLGPAGQALSYLGDNEEGARYTERAVRRAPGSGTLHMHHGAVLARLNRSEEALSHLKTAERIMPGSHLMWLVKSWQSVPYFQMGLRAQAEAAVDESLRLLPTAAHSYIWKARFCVHFGRDAEARRHIETARRLGMGPAEAERFWRRILPNNPTLEADIATIRALYAATEPGA